jgi:hypothetical protein
MGHTLFLTLGLMSDLISALSNTVTAGELVQVAARGNMNLHRIELRALLFCITLSTAMAQYNSSIQGVVTDPSGAAVPEAVVHVTDVASGVVREASTSNEGLYRVPNLGPGAYRVEVAAKGFGPAERPDVALGISQTVRADFVLKIGGLIDQVTVTGEVSQVETEAGRISARIEPVKLKELPMNGRNVFSLLAFQPGVTGRGLAGTFRGTSSAQADSFSGETSPQTNANGQRREANTFSLDDANTNSPFSNGSNITPSADSIEEIRVVSNNFSAVDGRGAGARIQVISKMGSNSFRGGLSEYFQNNTLASRNVFETNGLSVFRRNQFGYYLGGPIIKNRTFFFTSYEGLRQSGARSSVVTVETPAFRDWVIKNLPNTIAAKVFQAFPAAVTPTSSFASLAPNSSLVSPPAGLLAYGAASFTPTSHRYGDQFNARIDHELRPGKDKIFGTFYRARNDSLDGKPRPDFNRNRFEHSLFIGLNETHIFSPNKINEFKFGTIRYEGGQPDIPHPEIPLMTIAPIASFGDSSYPQAWFQYGINYQEIFSWIHESHSIKVGGEFRRGPADSINSVNYIPAYTFNDVLSFANDKPLQMSRLVDPVTGTPTTNNRHMRRIEYALFFQDDWKVKRNFTLNVGLRYEDFPPATDADGHNNGLILGRGSSFPERLATASAQYIDVGHKNDKNNFAPRFGFAWDPGGRGKTAIRGGYGITFDRTGRYGGYITNSPLRATVNLGALFGNTFTYSLGDPSKPYLGYPVDPSLRKGLDSRNGINGIRAIESTFDPNFATAYVHNWFFGAQQEIHKGWILELDYIGSAGHKLYNSVNVNRYKGDLLSGVFHGYNPSFSSIDWIESSSNSIYNAGTAHLRRPFAGGFTFEAVYTMGRVITDADSDQAAAYQDATDRRAERAAAAFDVSRRASLLGVWEIPFFKGKKGAVGLLFGRWQLSSTMIMQTGLPLSVTNTASYPRGDYNADGSGGDRPNNPAATVKRDGFATADYLSGIFKPSDFPIPTPGTNGNLGRNTFRGPGYIQLDGSLSKRFTVTERVSLSLRIDGYNLPNRTNLLEPVMDLNSNSFSKSTDTLPAKAYQASLRLTF